MRQTLAALMILAVPAPVAAQSCFDAAQCARDAIMMSRSASREIALLASELRSLRAERNAQAADLAALRETVAGLVANQKEQAERIEALEKENADPKGPDEPQKEP